MYIPWVASRQMAIGQCHWLKAFRLPSGHWLVVPGEARTALELAADVRGLG
jgi:hypothetical protein